MANDKIWYRERRKEDEDDFWVLMTPIIFSKERIANIAVETEQILALLNINSTANILDLCCGFGRVSLELAKRGFKVTGVDRIAAYLEQGRKAAEAAEVSINFIQEDMRHFCKINTFDAILNINGFGYFENLDEERQVINNIYHSLKEGGKFLIEMGSKEILFNNLSKHTYLKKEGSAFIREKIIIDDGNWVNSKWVIIQGETRREFKTARRLYSSFDFSSLLKECGFQEIYFYGNLAGSPYDRNAQRLVAVAYKRS